MLCRSQYIPNSYTEWWIVVLALSTYHTTHKHTHAEQHFNTFVYQNAHWSIWVRRNRMNASSVQYIQHTYDILCVYCTNVDIHNFLEIRLQFQRCAHYLFIFYFLIFIRSVKKMKNASARAHIHPRKPFVRIVFAQRWIRHSKSRIGHVLRFARGASCWLAHRISLAMWICSKCS